MLNSKEYRFQKACIATRDKPFIPEIEGIKGIGYLLPDTIFNLTELPREMLIIGSEPVGLELGQGFARLGSKVTIMTNNSRLLPREDSVAHLQK